MGYFHYLEKFSERFVKICTDSKSGLDIAKTFSKGFELATSTCGLRKCNGKFVNGKLLFKCGMFHLNDVDFDRIIRFRENGIEQKLIVNFHRDVKVKNLYEQIPFLMEGKTLKFEFRVNGKWQENPGVADEIRVNGSVFIRLSRPLACEFGPECRYQDQKMGVLRLHLGNSFQAGERAFLNYTITEEKQDT